jgi:hypothetical protein
VTDLQEEGEALRYEAYVNLKEFMSCCEICTSHVDPRSIDSRSVVWSYHFNSRDRGGTSPFQQYTSTHQLDVQKWNAVCPTQTLG